MLRTYIKDQIYYNLSDGISNNLVDVMNYESTFDVNGIPSFKK